MNKWQIRKINDLVESVSVTYQFNEAIPVTLINTSDVLSGKVLKHDKIFPNNVAGQFKKTFKKGDILFSEIRPKNERYALVDFEAKNYVASTKLMVLRKRNKEINNQYIYKYITSKEVLNKLQMVAESRSGTFPQITFNELGSLEITVPPINEQIAIANIVSSFDDKIEVNNKINNNLEELAQLLYKHWFVDFEFSDENGNPYKSGGGKMVDSELGSIPYGWEVKEQGEYFPIITGKKNANYSTDDGEFNFFTCSQQIFKAPGYSFEGSAILVAGNGDFNVKYYKGKFEAYQRTYVLIPHNEKLSGLLYFLIKENLSEITSGHRGSVIKFITKGDLDKYKIIMPKDIQFLEQMSRQFQNIINKIQHNNEENTKLAEMRDLLLPKLMSGEIRLPVEE